MVYMTVSASASSPVYTVVVDPTRQCDVECERRLSVLRLRRAVRRLRQAINRRRRRHASHVFTVRSLISSTYFYAPISTIVSGVL